MDPTLERERRAYQRHHRELVATAEGKYVLIRGDAVIGVFDSEVDALAHGVLQFRNAPFLVRCIRRVGVPPRPLAR
jgi:hypothetical protein